MLKILIAWPSPLHETFPLGSQANKTFTHLLTVKLDLGSEFQCSRIISVYNYSPNYQVVFVQVGLGKMQIVIFLGSNENLHLTCNCDSWVKNPIPVLKPGQDTDMLCVAEGKC